MNGRVYCRCQTVRCYAYDEAAEKLRCTVSWLKDNISTLPHQKRGGSPSFCECELALIQAMTTVLPSNVLALLASDGQEQQPEEKPEGVLALTEIRPSGARGKRSVS